MPPKLWAEPNHDQTSYRVGKTLLIATGALSVHFLPFWLNWMSTTLPHIDTKVILTRGARRFVRPEAITAVSGSPVILDSWDPENGYGPIGAPHVELAEWADAIIVYPASTHYLARMALGLGESPSLLTLRCFAGPIGIAPALPPGIENSPQTEEHLARLRDDPRMVLAPTVPGVSVTTKRVGDGNCVDLPTMLSLLEGGRAESTKTSSQMRGDAPLLETNTGLTRTRVVQAEEGGYLWRRSPGHSSRPSAPAPPALLELLPAPGHPCGTDFVVGRALQDPDGTPVVEYHVNGYRTLADRLLDGDPDLARMIRPLGLLGAGLSVLHSGEVAPCPCPLARCRCGMRDLSGAYGPRRLLTWLSTAPRAGSGTARLTDAALRHLGSDRLLRLRRWCESVLEPEGRPVHGGVSLGSALPTEGDVRIELLSGENLTLGPPELDLGWLLGELLELTLPEGEVEPGEAFPVLSNALLLAYERPLDPGLLHRAATLRVAVHAHDYAAYVGWHPRLEDHLALIAHRLDTAPSPDPSAE